MKKFNDYIHRIRNEPAGGSGLPVVKGRVDIKKADSEKMQAFGWASVSLVENGEQIEDWQEDMIDPEDLEEAAYQFVIFYRDGGEMHERGGVATLIESIVFTEEKQAALGIPAGTLPVGWWIGFQITDPEVWEKVKSGEYPMFSIEGEAERVEVDPEEDQ